MPLKSGCRLDTNWLTILHQYLAIIKTKPYLLHLQWTDICLVFCYDNISDDILSRLPQVSSQVILILSLYRNIEVTFIVKTRKLFRKGLLKSLLSISLKNKTD